MPKSGRSWVKVDGLKRQKVDGPQTESGRSTESKVDGPEWLKADGPNFGLQSMKVDGPKHESGRSKA